MHFAFTISWNTKTRTFLTTRQILSNEAHRPVIFISINPTWKTSAPTKQFMKHTFSHVLNNGKFLTWIYLFLSLSMYCHYFLWYFFLCQCNCFELCLCAILQLWQLIIWSSLISPKAFVTYLQADKQKKMAINKEIKRS